MTMSFQIGLHFDECCSYLLICPVHLAQGHPDPGYGCHLSPQWHQLLALASSRSWLTAQQELTRDVWTAQCSMTCTDYNAPAAQCCVLEAI